MNSLAQKVAIVKFGIDIFLGGGVHFCMSKNPKYNPDELISKVAMPRNHLASEQYYSGTGDNSYWPGDYSGTDGFTSCGAIMASNERLGELKEEHHALETINFHLHGLGKPFFFDSRKESAPQDFVEEVEAWEAKLVDARDNVISVDPKKLSKQQRVERKHVIQNVIGSLDPDYYEDPNRYICPHP